METNSYRVGADVNENIKNYLSVRHANVPRVRLHLKLDVPQRCWEPLAVAWVAVAHDVQKYPEYRIQVAGTLPGFLIIRLLFDTVCPSVQFRVQRSGSM